MQKILSFHSISVVALLLSKITFATSFSSAFSYQVTSDRSTKTILKGHHHLPSNEAIGRKSALKRIALLAPIPIIWSQGMATAEAKVSIRPDAAFKSLEKAREELDTVSKTYLATKDYDGMKEYLSDVSLNINKYEENANALLASKELDAESKKEIGTIRRYGVGADVIIMYGGLKAELEEEDVNFINVGKSLKNAMNSLDEVIAICRSNGF
jgi:hypothetical protein